MWLHIPEQPATHEQYAFATWYGALQEMAIDALDQSFSGFSNNRLAPTLDHLCSKIVHTYLVCNTPWNIGDLFGGLNNQHCCNLCSSSIVCQMTADEPWSLPLLAMLAEHLRSVECKDPLVNTQHHPVIHHWILILLVAESQTLSLDIQLVWIRINYSFIPAVKNVSLHPRTY